MTHFFLKSTFNDVTTKVPNWKKKKKREKFSSKTIRARAVCDSSYFVVVVNAELAYIKVVSPLSEFFFL